MVFLIVIMSHSSLCLMKNLLKCVLVIDGNPESGQGIKKYLLDNNLVKDVAVAQNTWAALNYIKQRLAVGKSLPNITFIDMDLPHKGAYEYLNKIHSQFGKSPEREVYLLSSSSDTNDIIKASMNPLSSGVINKPVTDREIGVIAYDYVKKYFENVA